MDQIRQTLLLKHKTSRNKNECFVIDIYYYQIGTVLYVTLQHNIVLLSSSTQTNDDNCSSSAGAEF